MWRKVWETQDGHQTGRWQWGHFHRHPDKADALYPEYWLWGDAICAPPNVGKAITQERKRGDDVSSYLGPVGPEEDEGSNSGGNR